MPSDTDFPAADTLTSERIVHTAMDRTAQARPDVFAGQHSVLFMPESMWRLVSESGMTPVSELAEGVRGAGEPKGRLQAMALAREHAGGHAVAEVVSERLASKGFGRLDIAQKERSDQSTVRSLDGLNMAVALPRNEDDLAKIGEAIPEGCVAVQDFDVGFVSPVFRSEARVAADDEHNWPEDSGIAEARESGNQGGGVLVGVLDTGVDAGHSEFTGRQIDYRYVSFYPGFWPHRDVHGFDTDGHGTHVSGIIAGNSVGVAPGVRLFVASVIESETIMTSLSRVAVGLDWLLRNFSTEETENMPGIINMSLGFPPTAPPGVPAASYQQRINTMRALIYQIWLADILPVVAIGNDGPGKFGQPGGFRDVVAVGAVDYGANVASFSGDAPPGTTPSPKPDVFGYGVDVFSSLERDYSGNSHYADMSGTSMATPYVSGIAALYRSRQSMTAQRTEATLKANAAPVSGHNPANAGLVRYV